MWSDDLHRFSNFLLLVLGYGCSRITGKILVPAGPSAVSIEPVNLCNLRCPECPAGQHALTRPAGYMDEALFQRIIDQLSPRVAYLTLYFQGEPYMHAGFLRMVRYAASKGIRVATSTNGHFFTEEKILETLDSGLARIIVSMDGFDQDSYSKYRKGGDFEKVREGIRTLVRMRNERGQKKPVVVLQSLVLRSNENELDKIRQLGRELKVDKVEFKTAQFYDFENGNRLMPQTPRWSRYARIKPDGSGNHPSDSYRIRNSMPDSCFRMWSGCVITWDGKVVPCCFDKDASHPLGDLTMQKFNEIWKGNAYDNFRRKILTNRKSVEICRNCTQSF